MKYKNAMVVTLLVTILILSSCASPAATPAATAEETNPTAAVEPTEKPAEVVEPTQATVAETGGNVIYSFPADSVQVVLRPEQKDLFVASNPDIAVDLLAVPEDGYDEKNIAMIAAGEPLDVFGSGDVFVAPFIHDGIALNLSPLIQKDAAFNVDDFYPAILDYFKDAKGDVYMLPGPYDVQRMYFNKKLFDDANIAYPTDDWTWDDFKDMAEKLTKGEGVNKQYGFMADTAWYVWAPYVWANGGNLWSEDGTRCTLNEPEAVQALEWYAGFMRSGFSPTPSELSGIGMSGGDMFTTGKVAMVSSGGWDIPYFNEIQDFEWGQVPLPQGPNGRATTLHLAMNLISSKTQNPDLAWKWLSFLASPEMYTLEAGKYGQGVPPRKSATEALLKNPPAESNPQSIRNVEIGLKSVEFGRTLPKILNISGAFDNVINPNLDTFWNGEGTAQEVTDKICTDFTPEPYTK